MLRELNEFDIDNLKPIEQEGFIQRFEFTFELAWKTAKDYLQEAGVLLTEVSPRAVIKAAFAAGIITDGQVFIDMMLARNLLSHTYELTKFKEILTKVKSEYLAALETFYDFLTEKTFD
ncbi:hypothetical protein FACS1894167_10030 [Synergistales bacterium]|nr:hypothetical protein FACS1894167_10030 [Synergistales bacterium]